MSANIELRLHEAEITQLLQPGEQLLTVTDFRLADGKRRVEAPPDPPDDRSAARKAGETAAGIAGFLVIGPDPPSPGKMLGGVSAAGHIGSWAYRLMGAYRDVLDRAKYLTVTDRRVLLISRKIFGKDPDFSVALGIPRDAVRNAIRQSRPLARGRVVIEFFDGSMIALRFGSVFAGQADQLVKVLTSPGTPPAP
jgi:hypothetical protein